MPNFNIVKEVKLLKTFRTASVMDMFDLQSEHIKESFEGCISFENEIWNIGIIVGNSGTGKTVIAKEVFKENYVSALNYNSKSVLDNMPEECSIKEIVSVLNSVGFSSIPSWLKPYACLSTGQKMRVDLARIILSKKEIVVFDEYSSVIDRNIAKIVSFAVSKCIRRLNKKFVAVSCHYDILEWLEPDWVFDTNLMQYQKKNSRDHKLIAKSMNAIENIGKCLGNIII